MSSATGHNAYSLRYPMPKKSGDDDADEERQAKRECAMSVIDYMLEDDTVCLPLYQFVLKRKARAASYGDDVDKDEQFKTISTFARLEPSWVIHLVAELSDLTAAQIIEASKFDEQTPRHLLQFALCYQGGLNIGQNGKIKAVLRAVFIRRHEQLNFRLKDFAKNGGLNTDKSINWKRGVYSFTFENDSPSAKLVKVTHVSGDAVAIDENTCVTRAWSIVNNHSDYDAVVEMKPLKPTPLCSFFAATKTGPYRHKKMSGDNKAFQQELEDERQAMLTKKKDGATIPEEEVGQKLKAMQSEKRAKTLSAARAHAQAVAGQVRQRRTLTCQKSAS